MPAEAPRDLWKSPPGDLLLRLQSKFSYKTDTSVDGKFIVHCKVKQAGVYEGFKMYVPVTLDFGDNRIAG